MLALAVTEYTFSYLNPSLLAASSIQLVLSRFLHQQITDSACIAYVGWFLGLPQVPAWTVAIFFCRVGIDWMMGRC